MSFIMRPARFAPTGVTIENSALFSAINQSLSRSQGSGSNTVWTFSSWIYKCESKNQVFCNFGSSPEGQLGWNASDQFYIYNGSTTVGITTQVFRDIGWYHIHLAYNTGESGTDKVKLSVNGSLVTAWATDNRSSAGAFNNANQSGQTLRLGNNGSDSGTICLSGYMSQICIIDGSAVAASSFINVSDDGNFVTPKSDTDIKALADAGASANSFLLDMSSNPQTDFSTHGNNFTNNNTVTTSTHTPSNLNALWNPLSTVGLTTRFPQLSAGNTTAGFSGSTSARAMLTLPVFYNTHLEFTVTQGSGSDTSYPYLQVFPYSTDDYNGDILVSQPAAGGSGGTGLASGVSIPNWTTGDRVTLEIDTTNGRIYVFIDGSAVNSANPSAGSGFTFDFTMPTSGQLAIVWINQTSAGKTVVVSNPAEFTDSVSTGYKGLTSTEIAKAVTLPESTIDDHFRTILYTGNGSTQTINTTIRPDFIWTKNRTGSGPAIVDAVRGATKSVQTNSSGAEFTSSNSITSLGSSSYDLGSDGDHGSFNNNTNAHVAWVAQLGGVPSATNSAGAGATPTAGSVKIDGSNLGSALAGTIPVTKLTASTELGMSVGTYHATGSAGTIDTLLSSPDVVIVKALRASASWMVFHSSLGTGKQFLLNSTNAAINDAQGFTSSNSNGTFGVGTGAAGNTNQTNGTSPSHVFYAWKNSPFCMATSWIGNNNANGTFVPTVSTLSDGTVPMEPRWALIKQSSASGQNWYMYDRVRDPINPMTRDLRANATTAESGDSSDSIDFLTSGIKFYSNHSGTNAAQTYVALIFGQPIISKDKTLLTGR